MYVAMINPRFRHHDGSWITIPPQGYGGIQWVVTTLTDGLLSAGHRVRLFGVPGSSERPGLTVSSAVDDDTLRREFATEPFDVVHDHSDAREFRPEWTPATPWVTTHHLTGRPANPCNAVYLSESQRRLAGAVDAPVVRLPVNPERVRYSAEKSNHLLFLGRVSPWKGAREAAAFAAAAGLHLWLAGPCWEPDYLAGIVSEFGQTVEALGEVGGERRLELLAAARAILVLSQPVPGPWGGQWAEPGSTVVSEAAASGTPVVATDNGCLPEIAPLVGAVIPQERAIVSNDVREILNRLPTPPVVRTVALREWGVARVTRQYEDIYRAAISGRLWGDMT